MSELVFEGGCLCTAIRYRAVGQPFNLTHCHCADCRRASGAAFVSWVTFHANEFAFTKGEPAQLLWATRRRTFCNRCGTPLTFQTEENAVEIDVAICSLDEPHRVVPQNHTWVEDRIPWIKLADGLPCYARQRTLSKSD